MNTMFLRLPLLCLLTLICTCGPALMSQSAPELTLEPYEFITEDGQKTDAEMGSFAVPENRRTTSEKQLTLRFVRFKSTNPNPGSPIVYLAGGPGGSGINAARGPRYKLFQELRAVADVIAYEQRGTGLSDGPPRYPGFWSVDPTKVMTEEEVRPIIQKATREAADFFASNGCDLSGYNTNESADDLNDLRLAIGAEKISLWGISYGSHLSLTTIKRHEKHLDRVVIAGVEGYDHTVKLPIQQQQLLEDIDKRLKANPATAAVFPDFLGDVDRLLKKLDQDPAIIPSVHPATGDTVMVAIGKHNMQQLMSWMLGGPDSFKDLPLAVQAMLEGDFALLAPYAFYVKMGQFRGMSMAMDLASGISPARRALLEKQAKTTLLGAAINYPYLDQYDELTELDAGKAFRAPYPAQLPVLCISGTLDGRTAVGNAVETLEHFKNGHHLIIEGAGHSDPLFLSSPRILEVMRAFFEGKKTKDERIVLPPVEWVLPE
ncbi:MAG: alpha/beta hydrolase [Lewinella sp.]